MRNKGSHEHLRVDSYLIIHIFTLFAWENVFKKLLEDIESSTIYALQKGYLVFYIIIVHICRHYFGTRQIIFGSD